MAKIKKFSYDWDNITDLGNMIKKLQNTLNQDFELIVFVSKQGMRLKQVELDIQDYENQDVSDELVIDNKITNLKSRLKEINYFG